MSDLKAKMHQIRFPLGLPPDPTVGDFSAPQTTKLYLRGLHLTGGTVKGRGGRVVGKGKENG